MKAKKNVLVASIARNVPSTGDQGVQSGFPIQVCSPSRMLIAVSESCRCDIALLPVTMSREFNECDLLLVTRRFQWGFLDLSDSSFEIISSFLLQNGFQSMALWLHSRACVAVFRLLVSWPPAYSSSHLTYQTEIPHPERWWPSFLQVSRDFKAPSSPSLKMNLWFIMSH